MVNTLFKGRLSRISSTGAASVIPKTAEVKSVSHGMFIIPKTPVDKPHLFFQKLSQEIGGVVYL